MDIKKKTASKPAKVNPAEEKAAKRKVRELLIASKKAKRASSLEENVPDRGELPTSSRNIITEQGESVENESVDVLIGISEEIVLQGCVGVGAKDGITPVESEALMPDIAHLSNKQSSRLDEKDSEMQDCGEESASDEEDDEEDEGSNLEEEPNEERESNVDDAEDQEIGSNVDRNVEPEASLESSNSVAASTSDVGEQVTGRKTTNAEPNKDQLSNNVQTTKKAKSSRKTLTKSKARTSAAKPTKNLSDTGAYDPFLYFMMTVEQNVSESLAMYRNRAWNDWEALNSEIKAQYIQSAKNDVEVTDRFLGSLPVPPLSGQSRFVEREKLDHLSGPDVDQRWSELSYEEKQSLENEATKDYEEFKQILSQLLKEY